MISEFQYGLIFNFFKGSPNKIFSQLFWRKFWKSVSKKNPYFSCLIIYYDTLISKSHVSQVKDSWFGSFLKAFILHISQRFAIPSESKVYKSRFFFSFFLFFLTTKCMRYARWLRLLQRRVIFLSFWLGAP